VLSEIAQAREIIDKEVRHLSRFAHHLPTSLKLGAMLEVPSLLYELDALMPRVDFISVGSNDLLQYFFAADRNNPRVSSRYDVLSAAPLRALAAIAEAAKRHDKPLSLCGEMAGRPLEAMTLIGLGYRSISMAPASIGPVKSAILSLDAKDLGRWLGETMGSAEGSIRAQLKRYAEDRGIEI
jgi:phosphotransferase system enzyme I (PtsP)